MPTEWVSMLLFWVAAAALSLAAAAMIVRGAMRAARGPSEADPALSLYRRQLDEIDDMVERGLLDEAERRAARAEAGRRLLGAAEREGGDAAAPPRLRKPVLVAAAIGAPLAALAVYFGIGSPGLPDQPFLARVDAWRRADPRTLDPPRMAAVLQTIVKQRPNDVQGLRFLAQAQLAAGDAVLAEETARKAIAVAPERAELWLLLGSALAAQSEGGITAQARDALEEALKRDPRSPQIRYYAGRARIETGRKDEGLALWKALLAELPPTAAERSSLAAEIASVERTGAVQDAQGGADAQMQATIRGMVASLAERLSRNPDDADGWVRLVRSYSVLGETQKRDDALAEARARFKDRPEVLSQLSQAAAGGAP